MIFITILACIIIFIVELLGIAIIAVEAIAAYYYENNIRMHSLIAVLLVTLFAYYKLDAWILQLF